MREPGGAERCRNTNASIQLGKANGLCDNSVYVSVTLEICFQTMINNISSRLTAENADQPTRAKPLKFNGYLLEFGPAG